MRVIDTVHSDQLETMDNIKHPDTGDIVVIYDIEDNPASQTMTLWVKDVLDIEDFIHTEYNDSWSIYLDDGEDY